MPKSQANPESLRQTLQKAVAQQQSGNLNAAERKYRSILGVVPNHTDALQFLAVLLQQSGKTKAALHFMRRALKINADNPVINSNQAEIFRLQGNYEAAETYANKALELNPDLIDPLVILGSISQEKQNYAKAANYYAAALNLTPNDITVRNELGNVFSAQERFREAADQYQLALEQNNQFDDCRINLADTLISLGEAELAISHYQILLRRQPDNIALLLKLARSLISLQSIAARAILVHALKLDKNNAEIHFWLGVYEQTMGAFEQAGGHFKTAIALNPDYYDPWYRLSLDKGFTPTDEQLRLLKTTFGRLQSADTNNPELITLGFSLGRFHEQRSDFDNAFKYYQVGNRIKTAQQPFDKQQHDVQIDNIIKIFDSEFFDQRQGWGNQANLPIFIVGMPRSGTTLVEQIISLHPSVHGGGELQLMLKLAADLKPDDENTASSHAQRIAILKQSEVTILSDRYLQQLQALNPQSQYISDKMPGNYFRLGVIFLLFPNAKIIHCQRDAMDTCWSCYQQNFESGLAFTNNLESLGHAYLGYQRLMRHWHQVSPRRIIDIKYETLLQNPESESRRLLDHCGLDWQPEVLNFHQQQRPVSTASLWQVRQPLYQSSIGRWRAYERYLQPLREILNSDFEADT